MNEKKLAIVASLTLGIGAFIGYSMDRARAAGIPATQALTYSGVLTDPIGAPLTGSKNIQISIYDMAVAGSLQCSVGPAATTLVNGGFRLALPDTCTTAVHATPDLWIEVFVDGSSLGRTKLGAVPYAVEADHAKTADSATNATNLIGTVSSAMFRASTACTTTGNSTDCSCATGEIAVSGGGFGNAVGLIESANVYVSDTTRNLTAWRVQCAGAPCSNAYALCLKTGP